MSDFESDLIQSMRQALAMTKGEAIGRYHHFPSPREVRAKAKLTQEAMAEVMGMSVSGYRKWEQGKRAVSGPAMVLLRVMAKEPDAVLRALK